MEGSDDSVNRSSKGFSGPTVLAIVFGSVVLAVVVTLLVVRYFFFPAPFSPVELNAREQEELSGKLDRIEQASGVSLVDMFGAAPDDELTQDGFLKPEPYSEEGASRDIYLTERELNALIANNTDLARKVAVDLSEDLVSAKLLVPVDADFPVLGGKTIRVRAGIGFTYRAGRPVLKLKGISLMGVPLPNAWMGGIKNVDLVEEYGNDPGFWKGFSDGIDAISVREGKLFIRLKE
ncbi:MAG: arginine N-succinyltransferase [Chlorobium phaeobacteroides]|uniref:Arginine N-succinyltransferase n=1 Tax=Chlorobium phaeobacteroides (strain BS1) TaxID=331678 RepID=B3ENY7_CHLPB|nr:arginine N-succinyltransferase [Chlorobium phaeobacteroides]